MKVTYLERIEYKLAWRRDMYCPKCGDHEYAVVEQLEPSTDTPWTVRCPMCEYETYASPTREVAIARWKQGNMAYD